MAEKSGAFEYNYLRSEIESNKRLVFERALLIAGAGLASTFLPGEAKGVELLGLPAIGALAFNLWFTFNRLKSNLRIIAYIQLFHEGEPAYRRIGWENALRAYRIWQSECPGEIGQVKGRFESIHQYDNLSFYNPILTLHLVMAFAVAVIVSVQSVLTGSTGGYGYAAAMLTVNLAAALVFTGWSLKYFPPERLKNGIEKNRRLWRGVFESLENGKLSMLMDEADERGPEALGAGVTV